MVFALNRLGLLLSLFLLLAPAAWPQQPAERVDPEWLRPRLPKRIVYSAPGMERIKARKDVVWKRVDGLELKLDVYAPPDGRPNKPLPAVVFIHGGPIPSNLRTEPKEWGVFISHGQLAASSGFVGVTFNHRYYGFDRLRDAQSDVNDLVAYLRANAATLGIDADRITLWAFSGGGLLLGNALREAPPYVRCLIAYYALLDGRGRGCEGVVAAESVETEGPSRPPALRRQGRIGQPGAERRARPFRARGDDAQRDDRFRQSRGGPSRLRRPR